MKVMEIRDHSSAAPKKSYVEEGETLWDIAGSVASEQDDIRRIIWEIQEANDIGGNEDIQPGQRLIIKF